MPVAWNSRREVLAKIRRAEKRLTAAIKTLNSELNYIRLLTDEVLPMFPAAKRAVKKSLVKRKQAKRA